jgi:hypothetical protein
MTGNEELETMWKEAVLNYFSYCLGIFLARLRKTTEILSQNSLSPWFKFKFEKLLMRNKTADH